MTDVKQKLIDAVQLEEKKIQASREKFEAGWDDDGQPVTNSELANRTNLHNAVKNADYEDSALSTLALAAISFILVAGVGALPLVLYGWTWAKKKLMATPTVMIFS